MEQREKNAMLWVMVERLKDGGLSDKEVRRIGDVMSLLIDPPDIRGMEQRREGDGRRETEIV